MKKFIVFVLAAVATLSQTEVHGQVNIQRTDTANVALSLVLDAPKGSIMPFALNAYSLKTTIEPKGWRICDGSEVSLDDCGGDVAFFGQLQAVYGYNSTSNKAYLPDFRGLFLRGVNGSRADSLAAPEKEQRFKTGHSVNTGDNVGTFQMDAIQNHHHWHKFFRYFEEQNIHGLDRATQANIYGGLDYTDKSGAGTALQGYLRTSEVWSASTAKPGWGVPEDPVHLSHLETRPKNAAVYWLIKVK
jgi:hypothetical protein